MFDYFLNKEAATIAANRANFAEDTMHSELTGNHNPHEDLEKNQPIFPTFNEPSAQEVGNVVELNCGHANRPSERESNLFHQHLVEAGLIPGIAEFSKVSRSSVSLSKDSSTKVVKQTTMNKPITLPVNPMAQMA